MRHSRKRSRKSRKHRAIKKYSLLLVLCILAGTWFYLEVQQSKPAAVWFEAKSENTNKVELPRDDAPHQSKVEWWYYNGHLKTESGREFSFHDTVFIVDGTVNHMVSHVSLGDHQAGKYYTDQRRTGGNSTTTTENHFEFKHGDWLMAGGDGKDILIAKTRDFSFDLSLTNTQPPVLYGEDGIISLGVAGSSYYYSRTRMAISGTLTVNGITEKVTGISWFDHQWGEFAVGLLSWDWFSLQLEDNIDVMIYQLRDKSNHPVIYTATITRHGKTEVLADTEFSITPLKIWKSSKTGAAYPLVWNIKIPKINMEITTRGIIEDSEFDARLTAYVVYWEGAVEIQGTHTGRGFMELSGY